MYTILILRLATGRSSLHQAKLFVPLNLSTCGSPNNTASSEFSSYHSTVRGNGRDRSSSADTHKTANAKLVVPSTIPINMMPPENQKRSFVSDRTTTENEPGVEWTSYVSSLYPLEFVCCTPGSTVLVEGWVAESHDGNANSAKNSLRCRSLGAGTSEDVVQL